MIFVNPFTGLTINANPEGHNQYHNPDGPTTKKRKPWYKNNLIMVPAGLAIGALAAPYSTKYIMRGTNVLGKLAAKIGKKGRAAKFAKDLEKSQMDEIAKENAIWEAIRRKREGT